MTRPLTLLPAIDVKAGRSVRVSRGNVEPTIGLPLDQALEFQTQGARWIHLVDLDFAFGTGSNDEALAEIISSLDISVQLSGGISDETALQRSLAMNPARVNVSASALRDLDWVGSVIARYGERIAVALDVQGDHIAPRGQSLSGFEALLLSTVLEFLNAAGCARIVVTDVAKDGSLEGPHLELLRQVQQLTQAEVIASGGVASLADIDALRSIGLEGAIVGKALYAGRLNFPEALERAGGVQ